MNLSAVQAQQGSSKTSFLPEYSHATLYPGRRGSAGGDLLSFSPRMMSCGTNKISMKWFRVMLY